MSENAVITEAAPVTDSSPIEGVNEAYQAVDESVNLEQALQSAPESEEVSEISETQETEDTTETSESKPDEFSSKFAALSRKEKAIRDRENQVNSKLAELEAKLAQFEQSQNPPEPEPEPEIPFDTRLKKDPLATLAEMGLSYEKLTELALNDGKLTPEMQLEYMKHEMDNKYSSKIEELRSEMMEKEKAQEEQKHEATIQGFKEDLTNFVNNNGDYELIRANDAVDLVFDVIEGHYKETGRILDNKEASDHVESVLLEEAEKLFKLNKIKSRFQPAQEPVQKKEVKRAPTLSNTQSAASTTTKRPTTRDESIAQAASLLKWND